jgi:hypothetical protein
MERVIRGCRRFFFSSPRQLSATVISPQWKRNNVNALEGARIDPSADAFGHYAIAELLGLAAREFVERVTGRSATAIV